MRIFIREAALFFCLLGCMAIGLDALLMHGLRKRQTHVLGVWNRLMAGEINAQILLTGSSRTFLHFDAKAIGAATGKRCYNIGMDGSQLNLQYPWLENYLEQNDTPELILQGVDIISLRPDTSQFFPSQYPPYLGNEAIFSSLMELDPNWLRHRYIPMYSFAMFGYGYAGMAAKGLLGLEDEKNDPLTMGHERRNMSWDGTFDRFKEAHPDGKRYGIHPQAVEQLKRTVLLAKKHDVPMVLVYSPELAENFALTIDREEIMGAYQEVADAFNIPFWDLSQLPLCEERRYFYNSQHLNPEGVDLLTLEMVKRIGSWYAHSSP